MARGWWTSRKEKQQARDPAPLQIPAGFRPNTDLSRFGNNPMWCFVFLHPDEIFLLGNIPHHRLRPPGGRAKRPVPIGRLGHSSHSGLRPVSQRGAFPFRRFDVVNLCEPRSPAGATLWTVAPTPSLSTRVSFQPRFHSQLGETRSLSMGTKQLMLPPESGHSLQWGNVSTLRRTGDTNRFSCLRSSQLASLSITPVPFGG